MLSSSRTIYLDNSSTTPVLPEIADRVRQIMVDDYGNPSSLHGKGLAAANIVKASRETLARSLSVNEEEIIFTSGASEANTLALLGAALANKRKGRHIIYSAIEHPSVIEPLKFLGQTGFHVESCPVDNQGRINPLILAGMVRADTILISIMMVNNEIGTVQNMAELTGTARSVNPRVVIHSDCVQALGKIPVKPLQMGIDILSGSAHKLHGPKGIGMMYMKKEIPWRSLSLGGGQEGGRRSGTENVPGIAGFAMAVEAAYRHMDSWQEHMQGLKQYLLESLQDRKLPFHINGPSPEDAAPHIINLSFLGLRGEVLVHFLEKDNIFISTGSACSSQKAKTSHVLQALGLPGSRSESAVRISLSPFNSRNDIECLADSLEMALTRLVIG